MKSNLIEIIRVIWQLFLVFDVVLIINKDDNINRNKSSIRAVYHNSSFLWHLFDIGTIDVRIKDEQIDYISMTVV